MRLQGREAIDYAEANDLLLNKYADPIEEHREGLTIAEANAVAREDPALIYFDISDDDAREIAEEIDRQREIVAREFERDQED
jgi:hypothetical protein